MAGPGGCPVTNRGLPSKDFPLELSVCPRLYLMEGAASQPDPRTGRCAGSAGVWKESWSPRQGGGTRPEGHWTQKREEDRVHSTGLLGGLVLLYFPWEPTHMNAVTEAGR